MPGQRSPDQKLIPVPMNDTFVKEIKAAMKKAGYANRAEFIRDAIVEKIVAMGIELPAGIDSAPDRFGKGGARAGVAGSQANSNQVLKKTAVALARVVANKVKGGKGS